MNQYHSLLVNLIFSALIVPFSYSAFGQEAAVKQSSSADVYAEISGLISKSRLSHARRRIVEELAKQPHDHELHLMRKSLGNALVRSGKRSEGDEQFDAILKYLFDYPKESRPILRHLPQVLINLTYIQQRIEPKFSETIEKTISLLSVAVIERPTSSAFSNGLTMAVGLKARAQAQRQEWVEAVATLENEIGRLNARWRADVGNPDRWLRLTYMLTAAVDTIGDQGEMITQRWRLEASNLLDVGVDRFPNSTRMVEEYFKKQLKSIAEFESEVPGQAIKMYENASLKLREISNSQPPQQSLVRLRVDIEKRFQRLRRELTKARLVGKSLPIIQNVDWIEPPEFDLDDSNGQIFVVCFCSTSNKKNFEEILSVGNLNESGLPEHSITPRFIFLTHPFEDQFEKLSMILKKTAPTNEQISKYRNEVKNTVTGRLPKSSAMGIASDSFAIAEQFGINETPTAIVVDEHGVCRSVLTGPSISSSIGRELTKLSTDNE